jgi:hypothetical protein
MKSALFIGEYFFKFYTFLFPISFLWISGSAGLDSSMFSHLKRNWLIQSIGSKSVSQEPNKRARSEQVTAFL